MTLSFSLGLTASAWLSSASPSEVSSTEDSAVDVNKTAERHETPAEESSPPKQEAQTQTEALAGATESSLHMEEGRIAYLDCKLKDAVTNSSCSRDLAFEETVWQHIAKLPQCGAFKPSVGEADLRIHYEEGKPTSIKLRGVVREGQKRLDGPSLLACLRRTLTKVKPSLPYRSLRTSFRFQLLNGSESGNN
ncbi:MAG: hypothetical protein IPJ88_06955 [Myxococcales bacterium]|nr:MAG: hypothetical protein IPJ88_06955 [Myxococcales bacterium]